MTQNIEQNIHTKAALFVSFLNRNFFSLSLKLASREHTVIFSA